MGLLYTDARNLLELRKGQSGGAAVTLGRQSTYFHPRDLSRLRALAARDPATQAWFQTYRWGDFADTFFTSVLKFASLESIDFSSYEGASIIHDLGEPVPPEHVGRFDLAVDCGTLEHVFNFPVAVANLARLVRSDGAVYTSVPCNNLCGHGFYQFSPELMHRIFAPANGFQPIFVRVARARHLAVELNSGHAVYDVSDPQAVHQRINLVSSKPVYVMALARRIPGVEPFNSKILQSDYVSTWADQGPEAKGNREHWLIAGARRCLPASVMDHVVALNIRRKASLALSSHYHRLW